MKKKYIIELEDENVLTYARSERLAINTRLGDAKGYLNTMIPLAPYTEPDLEQVRKEAYEEGYKEGMQLSIDDAKLKEVYQRGLADELDAIKKIYNMYSEERKKIFGENLIQKIYSIYSASEIIEKIRVYEQEQEKSARIEYNYTEIKDVIETTAKEYNMSLDEIAEVLKKMGEH